MISIRTIISTCPVGSGWFRNHTRIETPGICHQSLITAPRIDDLGSGELSVDSAQDRALAGLLCAGNGARLKPGESGRCWDGSALGQDAGGCFAHRQGIVRGSSGCRQGIDLVCGCVCGCVCGHLRGDRQSCGHFRGCEWLR